MLLAETTDNGVFANTEAISRVDGRDTRVIQVDFEPGITGSVSVQARTAPDLKYVELFNTNSDRLESALYTPFLKVVVTGVVVTTPGAKIRVRVA